MTAVPATPFPVMPPADDKVERPAYPRLYERREALEIVREWLVESEGELTPEIEELLNQAEGDFKTKVQRICLLIGEKQIASDIGKATAQAIEAHAQLHRQRHKVEERGVASLKAYLMREMDAAEYQKIEGQLARVRIQKNSQPSVEFKGDEAALVELHEQDSAIVTKQVTYSLNSEEAKTRWKAQRPLPESVKVELGRHVRIY